MNHWVVGMGPIFSIKLWHIVLGNRASSIFIIIFLNGKTGYYDILNDISVHVVLNKLIDTAVNANHSVVIIYVVYMIPITKYHFLWSRNIWILFVIHLNTRRGFMMNLKVFTMPLGKWIQSQNQQIMNS